LSHKTNIYFYLWVEKQFYISHITHYNTQYNIMNLNLVVFKGYLLGVKNGRRKRRARK